MHSIYVIKTVVLGTWVLYSSGEDSDLAHGVVSLSAGHQWYRNSVNMS